MNCGFSGCFLFGRRWFRGFFGELVLEVGLGVV